MWLRDSSSNDSNGRGSSFNPPSQQQMDHKTSTTTPYQQQADDRSAPLVVTRSGNRDGEWPQDAKRVAVVNSHQDQNTQQQNQKGYHHHHHIVKTGAPSIITQSASRRAREKIKSKMSSLAAAAVASLPKARKVIKVNSNSRSKSRKPTNKRHPSQIKNQRGGFKTTHERKLAQLIPVVDEHGVTIEDHFISPRDSDGDGIPDYFVLLRPWADSGKYDLGLFDDDIPVTAPVPVHTPAPDPVHIPAPVSAPVSAPVPAPIAASLSPPPPPAAVVAAPPTTIAPMAQPMQPAQATVVAQAFDRETAQVPPIVDTVVNNSPSVAPAAIV
ncbi:hypothetical protein FBU30_009659 [Linnemannia zychae]|nr:hypothetical protein FBU30_009659 [Linnemannia zychae]